jgi:hypothetical protein
MTLGHLERSLHVRIEKVESFKDMMELLRGGGREAS